MKTIEGALDAKGMRFGLVVSEFNEFVTSRLQSSAVNILINAGADEEHMVIVRVPGAFEIPPVARHLALSGRFDAIVCLGAVIRGATPHFDYIATETSRGIASAAWESGLPVVFGVLTTDTVEQAMERAGTAERNRGAEAARTAIEMTNVMRQLAGLAKTAGPSRAGRSRRRAGGTSR